MDIESLQQLCTSLPHVTTDIKWGADLCFCIGGKMFCVAGLDQQPTSASFKVRDDEFEAMTGRNGIVPAPYVARYKWVSVEDIRSLPKQEWEHYVRQSYQLVKDKLPLKIRKNLE